MLRAADVDPFIGLPYSFRSMDCADLALKVQRELFGKEVHVPGGRPRPAGADQPRAIEAWTQQLAHRVEVPQSGDLVLMLDSGETKAGHAGTYFFLAHEPWVLHTSHALGESVMHRLSDLPSFGLRVEGFYRWI